MKLAGSTPTGAGHYRRLTEGHDDPALHHPYRFVPAAQAIQYARHCRSLRGAQGSPSRTGSERSCRSLQRGVTAAGVLCLNCGNSLWVQA